MDSCWVRGVRVVRGGDPANVNLPALRRVLHAAQEYRDPAVTDCSTDDKTSRAEVEFRAAMDLDEAGAAGDKPAYTWPENRQLYPASQN